MNSNPDRTEPTPHDESSPDAAGRYVLSHKITDSTGVITTYVYSLKEEPAGFSFTHEQARGLFVLTTKEGKIERFREKPMRYLGSARSGNRHRDLVRILVSAGRR